MDFGKRLRTLRKEKELTQKALGEKIGVGRTTISEYESGKIVPRQDGLVKLAEILDVTVDYLTGNHEVREILPTLDVMRVEKKPDRHYEVNLKQQLARMMRNLHISTYDCYFGNTHLSDKNKNILTKQLNNVIELMDMILENDKL